MVPHRRTATTIGRLLVAAATVVVSWAVAPGGAVAGTAPPLTWHHATRPDPFRGYPSSVDCVGPGWCMFVDQSGQAVRYHDGHWDRPVRIEWAAEINGMQTVSCGSRRLCVALDSAGRLARFNGSSWSAPHYVAPNVRLENVSCSSATFCMALGNRVARWNGRSWRVTASTLPARRTWTAVSCAGTGFCMAILHRDSTSAVAAWRYAGHEWSSAGRLSANEYTYSYLSCTDRRFCMALGDVNYRIWDGTRWLHSEQQSAMGGSPSVLSCSAPNRCVTAESFGQTESAEWDGHTWGRVRTLHTRPQQTIASLSCVGNGPRCLAVDMMGGVTWYTQHSWHRTFTRDPGWGIPTDVSCGATWCIVADRPGGYVRTHGAGWSRPRRSYRRGDFGRRSTGSLSCTSDTFCLELMNNGAMRRFDGVAWHGAPKAPISGAVLSCVSVHWCAALDENYGKLAIYNGTSWRRPVRALGFPGESWTLACGGPKLCIASTSMGIARVFDGSRWLPRKRIGPQYQTWNAESCVSGSFCMVGGGWGTTWRYDGSAWRRFAIGGAEDSISCTTARFCAGVGNGQVQVFNGRRWTLSTTLHDPETSPYQDIGCASRSLCVVTSPANPVVVGTAG